MLTRVDPGPAVVVCNSCRHSREAQSDAEGVRGALREFELSRVADLPCRQLSAGQKRRAALARLAVVRRPLWFLDEPLSALDEAGVRHWLGLLAAHREQGGAAVITSRQPLPAQLAGLRSWELTPDSSTRSRA